VFSICDYNYIVKELWLGTLFLYIYYFYNVNNNNYINSSTEEIYSYAPKLCQLYIFLIELLIIINIIKVITIKWLLDDECF